MTRPVYMTARCTRGCEMWLTPEAMERHVREGRCNGRAWFRGVDRTMLVDAKSARLLRCCGAEEFLDFEHMDQYRTRDARRPHLPLSVQYGAVLSSPVADVTARVWWYVVRQHLIDSEEPAKVIAQAMTGDGFAELAPDDLPDRVSTCAACSDIVIDVRSHQQSSRRCQTAAAANRVIELWRNGFRDPWRAPDKPPLTWTELRPARWQRRITLVAFPRWIAVMIAPRGVQAETDVRPRRSANPSRR